MVVIADEAHRSQYGFGGRVNEKTGEMSYGFACNLRDALPNVSFIGSTGTPFEKTDANTRAVFGDYISIYDIQRAVADKATGAIDCDSRLAALAVRSVAGANTHFLAAGPGWTSATARKAPLTPAPAILASLEMNPTQKPFSLNRGAFIHRPV